MRKLESELQKKCVFWFRLQYPSFKSALFAVPNGGSRNVLEAKRLKCEGVTAGVSDLILLTSNKKYNSLCIEFKIKGNKQTATQKKWEEEIKKFGNKYIVCYSFEDFIKEIDIYIKKGG